MNGQILHLIPAEGHSMPMQPVRYTPESIAKALDFQRRERARVARELGIPTDLVALYDIHGDEQMVKWHYAMTTLRQP